MNEITSTPRIYLAIDGELEAAYERIDELTEVVGKQAEVLEMVKEVVERREIAEDGDIVIDAIEHAIEHAKQAVDPHRIMP